MTYPTQDEKHQLLRNITGSSHSLFVVVGNHSLELIIAGATARRDRSRQIITTDTKNALKVAKRVISKSQQTHKSHSCT